MDRKCSFPDIIENLKILEFFAKKSFIFLYERGREREREEGDVVRK